MKKSITVALALVITGAASAAAQRPAPVQPPATWVSLYGLMYTGLSGVNDPGSDSRWVFDDNAFGLGAALHRRFGQGLVLGVDGSVARPAYERQPLGGGVASERGTATVATAMANGRIGYGGSAELGFYLTGGIGTVAYHLEDLGAWNADFALQAGTGLEYRFRTNQAVALEWGRVWGYHEKEGLGGGSQTHSALRLAFRLGF